jgi:hypothetical protein
MHTQQIRERETFLPSHTGEREDDIKSRYEIGIVMNFSVCGEQKRERERRDE